MKVKGVKPYKVFQMTTVSDEEANTRTEYEDLGYVDLYIYPADTGTQSQMYGVEVKDILNCLTNEGDILERFGIAIDSKTANYEVISRKEYNRTSPAHYLLEIKKL
ncbi:hypothetical protein ABGF48_03285 [Helcococcus bovis]|uniref:hypothetical protein n=1 Tax=Helcococcus bovis TaxID=3153252 RepID=UPI0038B88E05